MPTATTTATRITSMFSRQTASFGAGRYFVLKRVVKAVGLFLNRLRFVPVLQTLAQRLDLQFEIHERALAQNVPAIAHQLLLRGGSGYARV